MNPSAILARGYSITRVLPEKSIVRDADSVSLDQQLEITLEKGALTCRVEGKRNHE
jgi:exodeoxyribonuclease VII large subunit